MISTAVRPEREITTFFYDDKARLVKTHKENYLGGQTVTESLLDFSGKVLKKLTLHQREHANSNEIRIDEQFEYSPQDRLLTHLHRVNDGNWEVLSNNTYDELGQLISKKVGKQDPTGASFLQKVDYGYNIRGWLTNINNIADTADEVTDLFAFKINYNTREQSIPGVENLYNGNICETYWRTESDGFTRMYGYQYDDLNRLLKGNYRKLGYSVTGNYDETLSYDKHGNIQTLQRNGFADADFGTSVEIDNLVYAYDGNQLLAVQDMSNSLNGFRDNVNNGTPDYGYDAYGNMTSDANKRIEDIDYNHLNLPTVINFQNNSGRIRYTYDALGVKVRKEVDDINGTTTTDYLDGFQYKNEVLSFFPTSEGYVEFKEPARFFYIYNYTDHLGNVRMSYTDNGTAVPKILEENHYYPFGLKHENYASEIFERIKEPNGELFVLQPTERREWQYKFQNKEWQDELLLNLYDYQARNYDPAIVRTTTYDPLAEKFYDFSPQSFLNNNPLRFIDPTGKESDDIIIRGKNVKTGAMEPAVVVKTDLINVTVDYENIPVIPTHDPITNKDNPTSPVVIYGVDNKIKTLEATFGKADAISVSLSGGIVAGGGISGGGNITAFLTGKDAGGVFAYSTDGPSPSVGLSVGGGVEVGVVFAAPSTESTFSRRTLTGYSVNLAGGYGPINGTFSMGVEGMFDWTPTSFSVSFGTGFSSFKKGASGSITNTIFQGTLREPKK